MNRRDALKGLAVVGATATAAAAGCSRVTENSEESNKMNPNPVVAPNPVLSVQPVGMQWPALDPFLFCVHHDDRYPKGNEQFGPAASLAGRDIGQDFAGIDGWRMYHGDVVPGFPGHPHRGFETITVVRKGFIDHSDSLGAAARYGNGDLQWLTAGKGILHAEMFPLLERDRENPLELFQIWLNLPRTNKFAQPHFTMHWKEAIPQHTERDAAGNPIEVTVYAGQLDEAKGAPPPPDSWAARADSDVAVWTVKLGPNAKWTLPAANAGANRMLYFFRGSSVRIAGRELTSPHAVELRADLPVELVAGTTEVELLLLQGRPINEPVVQYGPFVMNSREEIQQAFMDYQRTRFGGWKWPSEGPVHGRDAGRFARHADGRTDKPTT